VIRTGYFSILILTLAVAALAVSPAEPVDSTSGADESLQVVSIERLGPDSAGSFDTLEVTISPEYVIGGFDFKLATDSRLISIVDILPGKLIDSCRWEYFNARAVPIAPGENRLTALWQVVALAEMFAAGDTVLCRQFDREVCLMKIALAFSSPRFSSDSAAAVFFYWEDCSDNTIAAASGDTLSISREAVDFIEVNWPDTGGQFPTHRGAIPGCIGVKVTGRILPRLIFQNGGVYFPPETYQWQEDSVGTDTTARGDTSR
jgi:hypothetical protein